MATFHILGISAVVIDKIKIYVKGLDIIGAPTLKKKGSKVSRPAGFFELNLRNSCQT